MVVANQTLVGAHLTSRIHELHQAEPLDVHIVVPALGSGDDARLDQAFDNLEAGIEALGRLGVEVTGTVGHADPMAAIDTALRAKPAINLVLLSTLPLGVSRWIAMDLPHRVTRRYGIAVEHIIGTPLDASTDPHARGRDLKVLVVEDNPADLELATLALEGLDTPVEVIVAGTGAGAVQYLAEASPKPDLILADLKMPVMDGFTMLEQFASTLGLDTLHELNVVVLTSSSADSDRDRAHALGARAYVVKDPDFEAFQATIASLVAETARSL